MSTVTASPEAVAQLADVLGEGATSLVDAAESLHAALARLAAGAPDFAPPPSHVPNILDNQGRRVGELSDRLRRFVVALLAADEAGAGTPLGRVLPLDHRDALLIDAAVLETFEPVNPRGPLRDLVGVARAEMARLVASEPAGGPVQRVAWLRWLGERHLLSNRLRQYERVLRPPHPGWAGVHVEAWSTADEYLDAVQRAVGEANALLDGGTQSGAQPRPFLAAAAEHHALLTPERLELLVDLDNLAAMPLDQFLEARAAAQTERPLFDWTADGCSGPIPGRAQDACLRHDFLYRNGRMLRDQWGLDLNYALDIKDFADATFGDELDDPYPWWELRANGVLRSWLDVAEVAVEVFGDVSEPWNPPPEGAFFGSAVPHS